MVSPLMDAVTSIGPFPLVRGVKFASQIYKGSQKAIVIGEGMKRVQTAAQTLRSQGINAKWYQAWSKNFPNRTMTPPELNMAKARNSRWLRTKIKQGYKIYDIGPEQGRPAPSDFYQLEQDILKKYKYPTIKLTDY